MLCSENEWKKNFPQKRALIVSRLIACIKTGSGLKGLNAAGRAEKKLTESEVLEIGMGWRMRQLLSLFFPLSSPHARLTHHKPFYPNSY